MNERHRRESQFEAASAGGATPLPTPLLPGAPEPRTNLGKHLRMIFDSSTGHPSVAQIDRSVARNATTIAAFREQQENDMARRMVVCWFIVWSDTFWMTPIPKTGRGNTPIRS